MGTAQKKKKNISKIIIIPIVCLAVAATIIYFISEYINRPAFIRYPEFGIKLPANYSIHGIDVSHHQSNIDWEEVKAMKVMDVQLSFAFIKATEGVSNIDDKFRKNWYNAKDAGLIRGAYHFFICSKNAKEQAKNFIETVQLNPGDMPPVLDIEQVSITSAEQVRQRVKEWLQIVENYYHVKPIIYTYVDFYEKYLSTGFEDYPLWIAHYLAEDKPRIQRKWLFWQHNEKGHVNGISTFVDFNVFSGDSADFYNLLIP